MKLNPRKAAAIVLSSPRHSRRCADLHVHTTHSDGVCSPCEVVVAAARVGSMALAMVPTSRQHGIRLGIGPTRTLRWGIELIAGVELTCRQDDRELHILGYFIQYDDPALCSAMSALRAGRNQRIEAMVERLRRLGLLIDLNAVRRVFPRASLGRRHLADYLTRTRQVASTRDVFTRFLGDGCPACVDKPRLDCAQAIILIREAGGVAALAHPPYDLGEPQLQALVAEGLRAIEVDGPGFSKSKSQRVRDCANRLGLIGIAGSDFHVADRPGRWVGAITTSPDDLERLRQARQPNSTDVTRPNSPTGELSRRPGEYPR